MRPPVLPVTEVCWTLAVHLIVQLDRRQLRPLAQVRIQKPVHLEVAAPRQQDGATEAEVIQTQDAVAARLAQEVHDVAGAPHGPPAWGLVHHIWLGRLRLIRHGVQPLELAQDGHLQGVLPQEKVTAGGEVGYAGPGTVMGVERGLDSQGCEDEASWVLAKWREGRHKMSV